MISRWMVQVARTGLLLGARASLVLCSQAGPALDIDVEESFHYLSADEEAAFRAIHGRLT